MALGQDETAEAGPLAALAEDIPLPAGIAFLAAFNVPRSDLVAAARRALVTGVTADRALLAAGALTAEHFYRLLAEHLGVPFMHQPLRIADGIAIDDAMDLEIVPLAPNDTAVDFALAPRGQTLDRLLQRFAPAAGKPTPRVAITTPRRMAALVRHRHRLALTREASHGLPDWNPRLSALAGWSVGQWCFAFATGVAMAVGFGLAPLATAQVTCLALFGLFGLLVSVRLLATAASPAASPSPAERLSDDRLPLYTIVVPLYREARIVPRLTRALRQLDYPETRLDIKLMLEADDLDTLEAVQAEHLPDCFEVLLAPPGRPRTKPRALNIALRFALGDHLVIYDAEDEPEPGQLREAVAAFAASGPMVACLQARLAIDNGGDSWLTRLFALEYAALFDVVNPGLARLGLPIALGGTSNHFRTAALRTVNGWDAWNVTEDIDLGIRLARFGFKVKMLHSTTFEEAPHDLRAWLGQRRRWQKGWIVTLKTHSREPARLFAEIGLAGGLAVFALLCGTIASSLLWPLFSVIVVLDAAYGPLLRPTTDGERAWSVLSLGLLAAGAVSLLWPAGLAMRRRGLGASAPWLVLLPAYLLLLSHATWGALFEMAGRPYAWTKTAHGLAKRRQTRS